MHTPTIDKLAREGVILDTFYVYKCESACCPSKRGTRVGCMHDNDPRWLLAPLADCSPTRSQVNV